MHWIKYAVALILAAGILEAEYRFAGLPNSVHILVAALAFLYSVTIFLFMRDIWGSRSVPPKDDDEAISWPQLIVLALWVFVFRLAMLVCAAAYLIQAVNASGQPILDGPAAQPFSAVAIMIGGYLWTPLLEILRAGFPDRAIASLNLLTWQGIVARTLIYATLASLVAAVVRDWIMLVATGRKGQLARILRDILNRFYGGRGR